MPGFGLKGPRRAWQRRMRFQCVGRLPLRRAVIRGEGCCIVRPAPHSRINFPDATEILHNDPPETIHAAEPSAVRVNPCGSPIVAAMTGLILPW